MSIKPMRHGMLLGGCTAGAYATVAIAANFTTKYVTQLLPGAPDIVLISQLVFMLGAVHIVRIMGWVEPPPVTFKRWVAMAPLAITYGVHAALVLRALAALNVPMYSTLKRTTPMIVLLAKWAIDRRVPNLQVAASVLIIVMGCVIAGKGDLAFNPHAYSVVLTCAAFQAAYILLTEYLPPSSSEPTPTHPIAHSSIDMQPLGPASTCAAAASGAEHRHISAHEIGVGAKGAGDKGDHGEVDEHGKKVQPGPASTLQLQLRHALASMADAMQYVPLTCIPVLVFWVLVTDQMQAATAALLGHATDGMLHSVCAWLVVISSTEFLLMGTLMLCTQTNSALTTTVVGVLKGTLAVALGFVLLGGVGRTTTTNVAGITCNCLGGIWYAVAKYREGKAGGHKGPNSA